jgi:hypothetical protein
VPDVALQYNHPKQMKYLFITSQGKKMNIERDLDIASAIGMIFQSEEELQIAQSAVGHFNPALVEQLLTRAVLDRASYQALPAHLQARLQRLARLRDWGPVARFLESACAAPKPNAACDEKDAAAAPKPAPAPAAPAPAPAAPSSAQIEVALHFHFHS